MNTSTASHSNQNVSIIKNKFAAGTILTVAMHIAKGVPMRNIFSPVEEVRLQRPQGFFRVFVSDIAVFWNYKHLKKELDAIPEGRHIIIDFSKARLVDHIVLQELEAYKKDYMALGGRFELQGLYQN